MGKESVTVLMSTYNGECYLQEQLFSIYGQEEVDCSLLVRDDGSSDATVDMLKDEQRSHSLTWYTGENMGPARSFWNLVCTASGSDYYAFADQDDVWLTDKLKTAVAKLKGHEDVPALYFCQTQLVDGDLRPLESVRIAPLLTYGEALIYQFVGGSTMVFNEALRRKLVEYTPGYLRMHDIWVYDVALAVGAFVCFDPTPHILYRQHERNAVGQLNSWRFRWKNRWKRVVKNEHIRLRTAEELWRGYADVMSPENRELTRKVVNYRKSLRARMQLLWGRDLHCSEPSVELSGKLAIMADIF